MSEVDPDAPVPYTVVVDPFGGYDVIVACEFAVRVSPVYSEQEAIDIALSGTPWAYGDRISGPTLMDVRRVSDA